MFKTQNKNIITLEALSNYIGCIMLSLFVILGYKYEYSNSFLNESKDCKIIDFVPVNKNNVFNKLRVDAPIVSRFCNLSKFMGILRNYRGDAHFFTSFTRGAKCY